MLNAKTFSVDEAFEFAELLRRQPEIFPAPSVSSNNKYPHFTRFSGAEETELTLPSAINIYDYLAHILYFSVGCVSLRHFRCQQELPTPWVGRAIASGGSRHPTEVYLKWDGMISHYLPPHHSLEILRADASYGNGDASSYEPEIVLANSYSRTMEKYGEFAYRLTAVDLGVALGRIVSILGSLRMVCSVSFCFDDAAYNDAIGISGVCEAVYCIITVSDERFKSALSAVRRMTLPSAGTPYCPNSKETPPNFAAMHRAATATKASPLAGRSNSQAYCASSESINSKSALAFAMNTLLRQSSGKRFRAGAVSKASLFAILHATSEAMSSIPADLLIDEGELKANILVITNYVTDVRPGAYYYNPSSRELCVRRTGDLGALAQSSLRAKNINTRLAAFIIHIAGSTDFRHNDLGCRFYRIQQMLTGVGLDAAMIASHQYGLGSHVHLGFSSDVIDDIYNLKESGVGVNAQICIGFCREPSPALRLLSQSK